MPGGENGKRKAGQKCWDFSEDKIPILLIFLGIGEGNGNPLQFSCLENPMDGGAWWTVVHEVARSQIRLSNFTFNFHFPLSQPTPVFLPGESQGRGSLVGCHLWGCTDLDTTEAT